jgi:hypothetical protein
VYSFSPSQTKESRQGIVPEISTLHHAELLALARPPQVEDAFRTVIGVVAWFYLIGGLDLRSFLVHRRLSEDGCAIFFLRHCS